MDRNTPITVYEATFSWKIPNYRLEKKYSEKFSLLGNMILTIDLLPSITESIENGVKYRSICQKPIFFFANFPNGGKFANVLMTTLRGDAISYLPYSEIKAEKQCFAESNYRFLDMKNVARCLENEYTLTLLIDVSIKKALHHEQFDKSFKLAKDLGTLINDDKLADFTFVVDGRDFAIHKGIVSARSPVFRSIFVENEAEKKLAIENIEAEVFSALLQFLYTDNIPNLDQHLNKLLAAAYRFNVDDLKNICESKLLAGLNDKNASEIFQLAHLHQCSEDLKQAAFESIQKMLENHRMKMQDDMLGEPEKVQKVISLLDELLEMVEPMEKVKEVVIENKIYEKRTDFPFKLQPYGYGYSRKPRAYSTKQVKDREPRSEVVAKIADDHDSKLDSKAEVTDQSRSDKAEVKISEHRLKKANGTPKKRKNKKRKDRTERPKSNGGLITKEVNGELINENSEVAKEVIGEPNNGNPVVGDRLLVEMINKSPVAQQAIAEAFNKYFESMKRNYAGYIPSDPFSNGSTGGKAEETPGKVGITVPPVANDDNDNYYEQEKVQVSADEKRKVKEFRDFMDSVTD